MSRLDSLLVYYGDGERLFKELIDDAMPSLTTNRISELCRIMKRQGSDKGLGWHNYTIFYSAMISKFIPEASYIFEVGIGTNNAEIQSNMGVAGIPGASLRGWREFFKSAVIIGADIDRNILFEEEGIRTYFVDQLDIASIRALWLAMPHIYFDLIIDDGLHYLEANRKFLSNSIHRLKPNGLYIIEDIMLQLNNVAEFDAWLESTGYTGFMLKLPIKNNHIDNAIVVMCSPES